MVTLATVEQQLKDAGCNFRFWGRAEIRELCNILLPGEKIAFAVNGQYEAGFALLCATDFRILLIDKKPKYLTLKDIRFDMITELDFSGRLMNSTIHIFTPNKELKFTTTNTTRLRKLFTYSQHKVMELRHHFMMQQFQSQSAAANTPPGLLMAQQHTNEPLPVGNAAATQQALLEQSAVYAEPSAQPAVQTTEQQSLYNPSADEQSDEHRRLAAFMGATGLQSLVHNGQVIKEYMTVPFHARWRKRPYGFSRDSVPGSTQQQLPSA